MDKKIIIYSTPTCHFCHLAKEFFDEHGIQYEDHNVLTDLEKRQEMLQRSGQSGVPVIVIGDQIVIGFDQTEISALLGI